MSNRFYRKGKWFEVCSYVTTETDDTIKNGTCIINIDSIKVIKQCELLFDKGYFLVVFGDNVNIKINEKDYISLMEFMGDYYED